MKSFAEYQKKNEGIIGQQPAQANGHQLPRAVGTATAAMATAATGGATGDTTNAHGPQSMQQLIDNKGNNNKRNALTELVNSIKASLKHYDLEVRHAVWEALTSPGGKGLIERLLQSPNSSISISEFHKLID